MHWTLRYASHLGYRSPGSPLFRESVGSLDLAAHIGFAAESGFADMQNGWVASRPTRVCEQRGIEYLQRLDARLRG